MPKPKRLITLRLSDEEIATIDANAELAGESRTRYLARRGTEITTTEIEAQKMAQKQAAKLKQISEILGEAGTAEIVAIKDEEVICAPCAKVFVGDDGEPYYTIHGELSTAEWYGTMTADDVSGLECSSCGVDL